MKREKNKENTKRLIMETAISLFQQKEYQKTTIEEIVFHVGISKPTFFAYFPLKEQILYEYDLSQIQYFEEEMAKLIDKNGDLLANLQEKIVYLATSLHTTPIFTQNMMHLVTISAEYKQLLKRIFDLFQTSLQSYIQFGQEQNLITDALSSQLIAKDIITLYIGTLVNWVIRGGDERLEELMNASIGNYLDRVKKLA